MAMDTRYHELFDELVARWPTVAVTTLVLASAFVLPRFFRKDPVSNLPVVGAGHKEFMKQGGWTYYVDGYNKFKDGAYRITTAKQSPSIVISPKFLNELKKLPDETLSIHSAFKESMQAKYTKLNIGDNTLPHIIKASLTPSLARLNPIISEEVAETMRLELPQSGEWTEVPIQKKLLRIVAMVSGRIFVGPELCRNETYIESAINYTVDLMTVVHVMNFTPVWLRPIVYRFLPQVKRLGQRNQEAHDFLEPVMTARRKAAKDPDYQKPDDMLQWLFDSQDRFGEKDDQTMAERQLGLSFAAIHTTTITTTNAIYTLAAMPELAPVLREDVQQALEKNGGEFSSAALQDMRKLDSFMKEVLRYYPLSLAAFARKVEKSFTLSNGQVIPAGFMVEIPQGGVNFDEDIHEKPFEFDAMRHYRRRNAAEASGGPGSAEIMTNSQFVSIGASSFTFGAGRHACPGRFFAVNEIKMIMSNLLLNYDIKNAGGETERYKNIQLGATSIPNPNKVILMKKL